MGKKKKKRQHKLLKHLKSIGFTNRLSLYILSFLFFGLVGGFYLGLKSIQGDYMGSLLCWTVVFTPIGTAASIALSHVVDKSKAENTVGGIKYDLAVSQQFESAPATESIVDVDEDELTI